MTLERRDTNGNYEPSNCKWATRKEQMRNTRKKRLVVVDGVQYHVAELAEKHGIDMRTLYYRIEQNWPLDKLFSKEAIYNNFESNKKAIAAAREERMARTHCKHGHEFTPENTYLYKTSRHCKECRRDWDRRKYHEMSKR